MIHPSRSQLTILIAGAIATEALLVMSGWILGIDQLTRIVPIGRNMQFITAFLFLLSALGLYLVSRVIRSEDDLARLLLPGISLTIFLVTVTLLVGRVLGTPTGIEDLYLQRLAVVHPLDSLQTAGWPSFPAMVNFILFGLGSISALFSGSLRERLFRYFGSFILMTGILALLGYVLNIPLLYYQVNASAVPMAPNCAIFFSLLGIGMLLQMLRPGKNK